MPPLRALSSLLCLAAAAACHAGAMPNRPQNPERFFEVTVGSGINLGQGARYEPYLDAETFNYIPQAGLAWTPEPAYRYSLTVTKVNASNHCFFCNDKLIERYWKTALGAQRRVVAANGFLFGFEVFRQAGVNSFTPGTAFMSETHYDGSLRDEYTAFGAGLSAELPIARAFALGAKFDGLFVAQHTRRNTVRAYRSIDDINPEYRADDSPGEGPNLELYVRMGFELGY